MGVRGYKVFNPDWSSTHKKKYEVGETYTCNGHIAIHEDCRGFRFAQTAIRALRFYLKRLKTNNCKIAIVESVGDTEYCYNEKIATNKMLVVKELTIMEFINDVCKELNIKLSDLAHNKSVMELIEILEWKSVTRYYPNPECDYMWITYSN